MREAGTTVRLKSEYPLSVRIRSWLPILYGCFHCKKLAGDLRAEYVTETRQGYEVCPICQADFDHFWINLTRMKFQDARSVSLEEANEWAEVMQYSD